MTFRPIEEERVVAELPHTWHYCYHCTDWIVMCGECGNNCCNGGSGKSMGLKDCDCDEAYNLQNVWFESPECEAWHNSADYKERAEKAELERKNFWETVTSNAKGAVL